MWWKLAVGAVLGLVAGHFIAPGYALWVVVGLVLGYGAEVWSERRKKQKASAEQ